MARPIDIHLPGGLLLLTPPGLLPAEVVHSRQALSAAAILQRVQRDTLAMAELRREWRDLGLPVDPRFASDLNLVKVIEREVQRRRIDLRWLPHDQGQQVTETVETRTKLPRRVDDWTPGEKIGEALRRALTAGRMTAELRRMVEQLLDPKTLLYALPLLLLLAVPGGNAILIALAWVTAGIQGVHAMLEFGRATIDCVAARDEKAIDRAAEAYAHALVTLGTAFLARFLARLRVRGNSTSGPAGTTRAKPAGSRQPDRAPPPPRPTAQVGAATVAAKPVGTTVYRSDGRPPGEIFDQGFKPRGKKTDLIDYVDNDVKDSAFVGTSKSRDIYKSGFYGGDRRYLYQVDGRQVQGIDVNAVHPANRFAAEQEVAILGGVPKQAIVSARKVMADGTLGPVIPNPGYKGGP